MKRNTVLMLMLAATLGAGSANAGSCPLDMRKIDAAMAASKLSMSDMEKVKALREEGERLHQSGNHADSMAVLDQAKQLLGI